MELLNPKGVLVFSNNLRSFKLDPSVEIDYHATDITLKTLDLDFQQYANKRHKIHHCWMMKSL
jgi:23S rRNA (guanine2445-N2)-methyltransferase / 23S rRNA (guanine2069-N7)-methyltransferase